MSLNEYTHMSTTACQKSDNMMQAGVSVSGSDVTFDARLSKIKYLNYAQHSVWNLFANLLIHRGKHLNTLGRHKRLPEVFSSVILYRFNGEILHK